MRSPVVAKSTFTVDMNCNKKEENIHSDDVFDIGLILLICAIGLDLNFLSVKIDEKETCERNNNLIRNANSPKSSDAKRCCFLHTLMANTIKEKANDHLNFENCHIINYLVRKSYS